MKSVGLLLVTLSALLLCSCKSKDDGLPILATGSAAKITSPLEISATRPIELDGKTRAEILDLRKYFVLQHKELLRADYTPSPAVFGAIADGVSWYGEEGFFVYGKGASCNRGRSVEGRALLNPFQLLTPEFWGATIWFGANVKWARDKIKPEDLQADDFPFYCKAENLIWDAQSGSASASYDLSSYLLALNKHTTSPISIEQVYFGINSYNARDFGMNFLAIDPKASQAVRNPNQRNFAFPNESTLVFGDRCGCVGGCNMASPIVKPLNYFTIEKVPATLTVKLWRASPKDLSAPADFTYEIKIR